MLCSFNIQLTLLFITRWLIRIRALYNIYEFYIHVAAELGKQPVSTADVVPALMSYYSFTINYHQRHRQRHRHKQLTVQQIFPASTERSQILGKPFGLGRLVVVRAAHRRRGPG